MLCDTCRHEEAKYDADKFQHDHINAKAQAIFQRVVKSDILMASLPNTLQSEEEQLLTIQKLEEENKLAGERLKKAQRDAALWQSRVSHVLQKASAYHLNV